jgi:NAD(P)H-hydrate epimerase
MRITNHKSTPVKVVTVAEMQAVEREADASGLTYDQMMEHAGLGLAEVILCHSPAKRLGSTWPGWAGNQRRRHPAAMVNLAEHDWQATAYLVRPAQRMTSW